jgi:hypothetical protein
LINKLLVNQNILKISFVTESLFFIAELDPLN